MERMVGIVSFVIPAKNEECLLPETINYIHNAIKGRLEFEVVVMDNGSTDSTVSVAKSRGAHVTSLKGGTIGALRNVGVKHARGEYIVFLDADISLSDTWYPSFVNVLDMLCINAILLQAHVVRLLKPQVGLQMPGFGSFRTWSINLPLGN